MTRFKLSALFTVIALCLFILCGCWDQVELDTIAIVSGVGFDYDKDGVNLILQVGNISSLSDTTGGGANSKGKPYSVYETVDKTLPSAFEKLTAQFNRKPFLQHTQVCIIGRELAESGFKDYFDSLLRQTELRLEVYLIVSDTTAKELLEAEVAPEKLSADSISKLLTLAKKTSPNLAVNIFDFLREFVHLTCSPVLPIIKVKTTQSGQQIFEYEKMAIFKNLKMVAEMDMQLINGYIWLTEKLSERNIRITTEEGFADFKLHDIDSKVKVVFQGDKPVLDVKIKTKAVISGYGGYFKVEQNNLIDYFEERIKESIIAEVEDTFKFSQENRTDIFCLGQYVHRHYFKKWHTIKDEWDELFPEMKCNLEVKPEVVSSSNLFGGILKKTHDR